MANIIRTGGSGKNVLEIAKYSLIAFIGSTTGNVNTSLVVPDAVRISFQISSPGYTGVTITGHQTVDGSDTGTTIDYIGYGSAAGDHSYDVSAYKSVSIKVATEPQRTSGNVTLTNIKCYF